MAPVNRQPDNDRANRTIYVTGFNPKLIKRHLLKELFCQGGPVVDVTLFETHAYILFQHSESVPYCLAMFDGIEMFGDRLRLKPRNFTAGNPYSFLDHLTQVRAKLRDDYSKVKPPSLPSKVYADESKKQKKRKRDRDRKRAIDIESDSIDKGLPESAQAESENSNQGQKTTPPPSGSPKKNLKNAQKSFRSTSNSRRRKRGGKGNLSGTKKIQKRYKYLV